MQKPTGPKETMAANASRMTAKPRPAVKGTADNPSLKPTNAAAAAAGRAAAPHERYSDGLWRIVVKDKTAPATIKRTTLVALDPVSTERASLSRATNKLVQEICKRSPDNVKLAVDAFDITRVGEVVPRGTDGVSRLYLTSTNGRDPHADALPSSAACSANHLPGPIHHFDGVLFLSTRLDTRSLTCSVKPLLSDRVRLILVLEADRPHVPRLNRFKLLRPGLTRLTLVLRSPIRESWWTDIAFHLQRSSTLRLLRLDLVYDTYASFGESISSIASFRAFKSATIERIAFHVRQGDKLSPELRREIANALRMNATWLKLHNTELQFSRLAQINLPPLLFNRIQDRNYTFRAHTIAFCAIDEESRRDISFGAVPDIIGEPLKKKGGVRKSGWARGRLTGGAGQ